MHASVFQSVMNDGGFCADSSSRQWWSLLLTQRSQGRRKLSALTPRLQDLSKCPSVGYSFRCVFPWSVVL